MCEIKLPTVELAVDANSFERKPEYNINGFKIGVDLARHEELYKNMQLSDCICAGTAATDLYCSKSREDELREELKQKDEEIKHLKSVANALADDLKFERLVKDALARDCAAAAELADSLKKKIEYCKKNGIWAEEDESKQVQ